MKRLRSCLLALPEHVARFAMANRRATSVVIHIGLIVFANYFAFALRFDGALPPDSLAAWKASLLVLVVVRSMVFAPLRLYEGLWRYTGIWDLQRIAVGIALSSTILWIVLRWIMRVPAYPRTVFFIDAFFLAILMGGIRMARRIFREARGTLATRRVLIVGAGDAGEMIARDMHKNRAYGSEPFGFLDDDPEKTGKRIHGIPVLGTRRDVDRILTRYHPDEILIAIPSETPANLRRIALSFRAHKIPITTLPSIRDLVQGRVNVSLIRPLAIEDLLARAPVGLDPAPVKALIAGRRVLVTGAGGSIGSELCRQIAALGPARLALVDRYENSLHGIALELGDHWPSVPAWPYLADMTDRKRVEQVFGDVRPEIVFHAAAHKHVPMVEMNPSEGFKNNVLGTRNLVDVAAACGVDRFLLISTDKAVNPTNVMGATKRVAEFCLQNKVGDSATTFCAVRFGNVLGSNGSVVPRFLEQIKDGGPVTVTHPDVKRFFMLIPEAVQLVLHAAAQALPGAVYVLEMGDQLNIAEMARSLIRLTGHIPDDEIELKFVGLRPGEKLFEELVGADETAEPSGIDGIYRVVHRAAFDRPAIEALVARGIAAAIEGSDSEVVGVLKEIVPTYRPPVPGVGASGPSRVR
jgi:FlaA1/EpsC-like NDP-sugar epimerase